MFEDDFDEMVLKRSKEQITNCDPLENLENLDGHTFQSSVERETASRFVIFYLVFLTFTCSNLL